MRTLPVLAFSLLAALAVGCGKDDDSTPAKSVAGAPSSSDGGSSGAEPETSGGAGAGGVSVEAGGSAGTPVCDDGTAGAGPVEMIQHEGNWRIMLLGDSITQSTCYPQLLSQLLLDEGRDQFDFLGGTWVNQGCGAPAVWTEGHGGYLVSDLVPGRPHEGELEAWLAALRPEPVGGGGAGGGNAGGAISSGGVSGALGSGNAGGGAGGAASVATPQGGAGGSVSVAQGGAGGSGIAPEYFGPEVALVHFGTNDAWSSVSTTRILDAYTFVVEQLRAANPNVILFFAQIIPLAPTDFDCSRCPSNVENLNDAIPAWAESLSTDTSPIYVVDVNTCFDVVADTRDGVHPNPQGSQKMADDFAAALHREGIL